MYLFADSSRLSVDEIFFFFFLPQNNFQFILPYFPLEQGAHWHSEGIIWFRSNPYTQVFYSQCNYIFVSPRVPSVLFHFQVPLQCHPLIFRLYFWGANSEDTDDDQRSNNVLQTRKNKLTVEICSSFEYLWVSFSFHSLPSVNPETVKASASASSFGFQMPTVLCIAIL